MNEVHAMLCSRAGHPVPLVGVDVEGEVVGGVARIVVRQRYRNDETSAVEAVYTFPLPSQASLDGFVLVAGQRRLESRCFERDEAFAVYDEALLGGDGAALLDQERDDVFTAQVGNLLPGEDVSVEIRYVQPLLPDEGALRLVIPTLVAPRYIPGVPTSGRGADGHAEPTDRVPDADRISPPVGNPTYRVGLDLQVRVASGARVASPSHRLDVTASDGLIRVRFADGRVPLDRDLVLNLEPDGPVPLEFVSCHRGGDVGTVALAFVPELPRRAGSAHPLDVVFVLDRSGSMADGAMGEAQKALRLCLRQLRAGDRFTILTFDDRVERFRPELVPFDQKNLEAADRYVRGVSSRGGTELLSPLLEAVGLAGDGLVVLLTDGQVGNEDEIARAVLGVARGARVECFGIGLNVAEGLLRRLARETGGGVEFIHPGERIDEKVVATFARAIAPRVRKARLRVEGARLTELAPEGPIDLVDGVPLALYGRYDHPGDVVLHFEGTFDGAPYVHTMRATLPAEGCNEALPKLWARERIRALEAVEVAGRRAGAMKDRIVALGTEHGVVSRHTSFVVVERREGDRVVTGGAALRTVPVHAPGSARAHAPSVGTLPPSAFDPGAMMFASVAQFVSMPADRPAFPSKAKRSRLAEAIGDLARPSRTRAKRPAEPSSAAPFAAAAPPAAMRPPAVGGPPPSAARASSDPVFELLATQAASGLFGPGHGDPATTVEALVRLLALGLDTSHPLYGEAVRKAVEALLARLSEVAPESRARGLAAASVLATGKRTRSAVAEARRRFLEPGEAARLADTGEARAALGLS